MVKRNEPTLNAVPLADAWPPRPGGITATIAPGQWDETTAVIYDLGGTLVEVDDEDRPVRAYRRPTP